MLLADSAMHTYISDCSDGTGTHQALLTNKGLLLSRQSGIYMSTLVFKIVYFKNNYRDTTHFYFILFLLALEKSYPK